MPRWVAIYEDGSRLDSAEAAACAHPDGDHGEKLPHVWACVDKERVRCLDWCEGEDVLTRVPVPAESTPILFRRHVVYDALAGAEHAGCLYVSGWQRGPERKVLVAIMLDGSVVVTTDDADLQAMV